MRRYLLLALAGLLLWVQPATAATPVFVALGAGNPISTASTTASTPITWSHTVNSGEVLILIVGCGGNITPGSVTYNSAAPTATIVSETTGAAKLYAYGWRTPSTGSNTVSWTPDDTGVSCASGSATYSGADTTTTWQNATTGTNNTNAPTITVTSASGEKAIGAFTSRSFTPFSTTAGTQRWIRDGTSTGQGAAEVDDTGSAVMSWSVGGSGDEWDTIGFSLIGASAASTGGVQTLLGVGR